MDDETVGTGPLDELDALMDMPERWPAIPIETLHQLVYYQCLSYGMDPDDDVVPGLTALCRVAVARMHPGARQQIVTHLARAVERVHRERDVREGAGCTNALLPFLVVEPDPTVVTTAAWLPETSVPPPPLTSSFTTTVRLTVESVAFACVSTLPLLSLSSPFTVALAVEDAFEVAACVLAQVLAL